jgi:hypothetical protein
MDGILQVACILRSCMTWYVPALVVRGARVSRVTAHAAMSVASQLVAVISWSLCRFIVCGLLPSLRGAGMQHTLLLPTCCTRKRCPELEVCIMAVSLCSFASANAAVTVPSSPVGSLCSHAHALYRVQQLCDGETLVRHLVHMHTVCTMD